MKFHSAPSFDKDYNKLDPQKQQSVKEAVKNLIRLYETRQSPQGLGLKQLRKNLWEIRSSLKDRVLFYFEKDIITFILIGSHDDISKYLKNS